MTIDAFKKTARKIQEVFFLPLLLPFHWSSQKALIVSDVERWVSVEYHEGAGRSAGCNLIGLMARYKEFRNLFYYRFFQGRFWEVLFAYVLRIIYRPSSLLFLQKTATIGPGLFIQHGFSTIIDATIGANCWINQQVTMGYKDRSGRPTLGDHVRVSAGAVILGRIFVGDNVVVGANAVVVKDVPPDCVVGGVPARIIKRRPAVNPDL